MEQLQNRSISKVELQGYIKLYAMLSQTPIVEKSSMYDMKVVYEMMTLVQQALHSDLACVKEHLRKEGHQNIQISSFGGKLNRSDELTEKELEILHLFAKGYSYKESAELAGCKLATVQTHAKHIYGKLGVHSRSEAIFEASRLGLITF